MRLLLTRGLLFLLPFALYFGFALISRRVPQRQLVPWLVLTICGLVLVAGSFVYLGPTAGESTTGTYVPAHVVNGKIVPGHVEKVP